MEYHTFENTEERYGGDQQDEDDEEPITAKKV